MLGARSSSALRVTMTTLPTTSARPLDAAIALLPYARRDAVGRTVLLLDASPAGEGRAIERVVHGQDQRENGRDLHDGGDQAVAWRNQYGDDDEGDKPERQVLPRVPGTP